MNSGQISPPGNTEAKLILLAFSVSSLLLTSVLIPIRHTTVGLLVTYTLPLILLATIFLAVRLACYGTAPIPIWLGMIGCVYIVGGPIFDMLATIIHTPDLKLEGNVIARLLLDNGHSVTFLYVYAIVAQTLLMTLTSALWLSLLTHRAILAAEMGNPRAVIQLLKAAVGGGKSTWSWRFTWTMSDLPQLYPLLWLLVVGLVACASDHWYLGLEWFKLISTGRVPTVLTIVGVAYVLYFSWLWHASRTAAAA
jgi:hypothetical protein